MQTKTLIETILLLIIGVGATAEGTRLIIYKDPHTLYDVIGPGYYIFVLSFGLIATGIWHVVAQRKELALGGIIPKGHGKRLLYIVGTAALYLFLINYLGYLLPTVLFFLMEFRLAGVKSWKANIIMTFICTATYYAVFIKYCSMVFPRGIFDFLNF